MLICLPPPRHHVIHNVLPCWAAFCLSLSYTEPPHKYCSLSCLLLPRAIRLQSHAKPCARMVVGGHAMHSQQRLLAGAGRKTPCHLFFFLQPPRTMLKNVHVCLPPPRLCLPGLRVGCQPHSVPDPLSPSPCSSPVLPLSKYRHAHANGMECPNDRY